MIGGSREYDSVSTSIYLAAVLLETIVQTNTMNYTLQPATAAHQPIIKQLIREAHLNPIGINWERFRLACDPEGMVIGCAQVKPHRDGSRELASLVVRKPWRKRGISRALISALMERETEPLWLTCASNLVPYYQKFGFEEVTSLSQMPAYYRWARRAFDLITLFRKFPGYLAVMTQPAAKIGGSAPLN